MLAKENRASGRRIYRQASLALVAFLVLLVAAGLALTRRGQSEMQKSDAAFHEGDLRQSMTHARKAALAYLPGAEHVKEAHRRLEAIARGAESEGRFDIARLAWNTLRIVHEQTHYPGRPKRPEEERARLGLERLQQVTEP